MERGDQEVELPAGASMWREAEEHAAENIGGGAIRAIFFEPQQGTTAARHNSMKPRT
jgi:hypothetical protein